MSEVKRPQKQEQQCPPVPDMDKLQQLQLDLQLGLGWELLPMLGLTLKLGLPVEELGQGLEGRLERLLFVCWYQREKQC